MSRIAIKRARGGSRRSRPGASGLCGRMRLALPALFLLCAAVSRGQDAALKTNVLYDAACTVNAGVEIGLAPKWSLDLSGNYDGWTIKDRKWKHWLAQPEARYWFCDRFAGHFVGLHALGGQYNVGNIDTGLRMFNTDFSILREHRVQGWAVGAGVAYGYAFVLGEHWNLELEAGFGYVYTRYDVYECEDCGRKVLGDRPHNYVGPTKAALNLVYIF